MVEQSKPTGGEAALDHVHDYQCNLAASGIDPCTCTPTTPTGEQAGTCGHCGGATPHQGTSWKESAACQRAEVAGEQVTPATEVEHPLVEPADIDAELRELQSFVLVETGHVPTVQAVSRLRARIAKALGHSDPWCVSHCIPGVKHTACGCDCGQHRKDAKPRKRSAEGDGAARPQDVPGPVSKIDDASP